MVICNYCGEDFIVTYICRICNGKFCKTHRRPEDHDCPSIVRSEVTNNIESDELESNGASLNPKNSEVALIEAESSIVPINTLQGLHTQANAVFESMNHESDNGKWGFLNLNLVLVTLLVASLAMTGTLYLKNKDYQDLYFNYMTLYNNTETIQSYYDELTGQYSELREEYTQLNEYYSEILSSHAQLKTEYDNVMNYRVYMEVEEERIITLGPDENYSMVYQIPFSGYIDVCYNASGDVYVWVGSTTLEGFYSRFPQFPGTASELNFTLPVLPDVIIYFANPDEFEPKTITYNVNYTY